MHQSLPDDSRPVVDNADLLQAFQLDRPALRGRMVRLSRSLDGALAGHACPLPVATLLAEALALAALLGGMLKYEGIFTLQAKGNGPVRMLVADMTSDGAVRGYAQFDGDRLAAERDRAAQAAGLPATRPEGRRLAALMAEEVPRLLGHGHLAFTVDQGIHTQRYQGIVALDGATLVDCVHHYFTQSEQMLTRVKLAVGRIEGGANAGWHAGALLLQQMPAEGEAGAAQAALTRHGDAQLAEDWRRATTLLDTATDHELIDPEISVDTLLWRLFHEEEVRRFEPKPLRFSCRCSRTRVETALRAIPVAELREVATDGAIDVTCEFCATRYTISLDALI